MSTETSPGESTSSARPWWRRWSWLAPLALLVVMGAAAATGALSARDDLQGARRQLQDARAAVADGDIEAASTHLEDAAARLGTARSTLRRPDLRLARLLPFVGDDLATVNTIVDSGVAVTDAAIAALSGARQLTEADLGLDGLPVDTIEALGPLVRQAAEAVTSAVVRITATDAEHLLQEVAEGRREVLELLTPIEQQLGQVAEVVEVLPRFLGADRPRRYFLGAVNPAELRGTGGYLGSYTLLTIDRGRLEFGSFLPQTDLAALDPDDLPRSLLPSRYEPFGSTWQWKTVNMSPDMPGVGRTLTQMWARQTGEVLDGVLLVDPFAIETMLEVTGPVTVDDFRLDADNAVDYLTNEAYEDYDDPAFDTDTDLDEAFARQRKEDLGEAAKVVLQEFLRRGNELFDQLDDVTRLISERQLQLYASDATIQRAFAMAGLDGALPDPEGDFLTVVANSAANAKVDYYLDRTIQYDVQLGRDFDATADLSVTFHNNAPVEGQPEYVIGPNVDGLDAGENQFYLSTFCSTRCAFEGAEGGLSGQSLLTEERAHPVAGTWVRLPAGREATLRYRWHVDDAWRWEGRELVYRLLVRTQTAVRRPTLRVNVTVPDGFRFAGGSSGLELQGSAVQYEERPRGDVALEVRLLPEDDH